MGRRANKTLIGAFVVGAIALAAAGVVVFGSGRFFSERVLWVMYFEGSVKGLNVGAPVSFRGVKLGSVTDIQMRFHSDLTIWIPVFIEIVPSRISGESGSPIHKILGKAERRRMRPWIMQQLIDRGLRARLETQSLVTGQLMVGLDFYPDKPARLVGDGTVPEVPTIPSSLAELSKTIEKLPLEELVNRVMLAVEGIEQLVSSPELKASLTNLNKTLKDTQDLVRTVNRRVDPLTDRIEATLGEYGELARHVGDRMGPVLVNLDQAVQDYGKLAQNVDGRVAPLISSIEETLKAARTALNTAQGTLASAQGIVGPDSPVVYELTNALREITSAARTIRIMADYFKRHPESLIRGAGGSKGR
jgi:paraquat-inducible protein B